MSSPLRPIASTGVALLSAGMIAASPLVPPPTTSALVDFPVELTAGETTWMSVLDLAGTNLKEIFAASVSAVTGESQLVVEPLELLLALPLAPVQMVLGVSEAVGEIPDVFADILRSAIGSDPLEVLPNLAEAVINAPAGIINAVVNGTADYAGLLTWDATEDAINSSGLLADLVVGVPAIIGTLFSGSAAEFSLDSLGVLDPGLLDLPMSLLDGLPGFDWLSGIFSTLLEVLMPF
ncbi:hypothetical protein BHQ15_17070 [Mycolicibacillus koreensis]|nr:hypothetical protein BHQ15_17070 [Mycolicibacillus koreensis]